MYIPHFSSLLSQQPPLIATPTPLNTSRFSLDTSSVVGFFGGDEAISAMATVHVYSGRRWLGWYNTPGSYQIARQYGLIAKSLFFKGLFPGVRSEAAKLFEFDGWQGPRFQAAASGTIMDSTCHLASLLMKECASIKGVPIPGREGHGAGVTIVNLKNVPSKEVDIRPLRTYSPILAIFPIATSIVACIASGVYKDWFAFSLIAWGILSNGISCFVIGSGALRFTRHIPAKGSPRGDGILGSGKELVILLGNEGAVSSVTVGRFSLVFPSDFYDEYIGCCSILLSIQFLAQLFLIPQASLFGQIMFISSMGASWAYNLTLSTFDKEKIQQRILLHDILGNPSLTKYALTSRTSAIVFALCVLSPENPSQILNAYLPNDTKVWRKWKETVLRKLFKSEELVFTGADLNLDGSTDDERELLLTLCNDARIAYNGYRDKVAPAGLGRTVATRQISQKLANGTAS